jgi:hypothetical protein
MEQQPQDNALDNFFNLSFDAAAREQLKKIALWAKIVALSAFIGYAISIVIAIFGHKDFSMEAEGFSVGAYIRTDESIVGVLITVVIGVLINYFLYRFSISVRNGVDTMDTFKLNEGLSDLRTYFKIYGILLLIALIVFGLIIVFGILSALARL